ncbi:hypothetical protein [Bordetella genomosp. 11]|uniref:Uncharacterized protein n=1 Tax=Bordetella genomosp. 11 TaxID=1416808 RepID=A0A261UEZ5_9BORD|nr:hypothetical protein [Bordetella genomosp. 11]OZI60509.1 hypothetical protein CAL28_13910 [Bordetella genomosp. 11]
MDQTVDPDDQHYVYFAQVQCADFPTIDAVEIEGCGYGVLLVRYFSYRTRSVEGDHWYGNAAAARAAAELQFGIDPENWSVRGRV